MTEHVNIPDSQRHEPRGASTATSGQILQAQGDGTTQWVTPSDQPSNLAQAIITSDQTLALVAASDSTLETNSDYVKWGAGWVGDVAVGTSVNFSVDKFEINESGTYLVTLNAMPEVNLTGLIAFKFSTDDTNSNLTDHKIINQMQHTNHQDDIGTSLYMNLVAGNEISLWVAAETASNLTIGDLVMHLRKV